ncbi:hypothetical protein [Mycolicibacterium porcinum]|uniref:Uncharacterized protein n=1 Tax=Mycolicibacterium porcinum TaxID=39693 RepID=A0ABV3VFS6_9MYCO
MTTQLDEAIKRMMTNALDIPTLTATDRHDIIDIIARVDLTAPPAGSTRPRDTHTATLTALLTQVRDIVAQRRTQTA